MNLKQLSLQGWIQGGQDLCTPLRFQNRFSKALKRKKTQCKTEKISI